MAEASAESGSKERLPVMSELDGESSLLPVR